MNLQKPLIGRLVRLEIFEVEDVDARYVDWLNDPELSKYLDSNKVRQDLQSCREFVSLALASNHTYFFRILEKETGIHVGNIKLGPISSDSKSAAIGIIIGERAASRRGFASDAIKVLTDWAFSELNLLSLRAGSHEENIASIRLFEKNGFRVTGFHPYEKSIYALSEGRRIVLDLVNPKES